MKKIAGLLLVMFLATTFGTAVAQPPTTPPPRSRIPPPTRQGCQPEGGDYLVDIRRSEILNIGQDPFPPDLPPWPLVTMYGFFGPCCFKSHYYVNDTVNGFPNNCCRPPDGLVGNGPWNATVPMMGDMPLEKGNPCQCPAGLNETTHSTLPASITTLYYTISIPGHNEEWFAVMRGVGLEPLCETFCLMLGTTCGEPHMPPPP